MCITCFCNTTINISNKTWYEHTLNNNNNIGVIILVKINYVPSKLTTPSFRRAAMPETPSPRRLVPATQTILAVDEVAKLTD